MNFNLFKVLLVGLLIATFVLFLVVEGIKPTAQWCHDHPRNAECKKN